MSIINLFVQGTVKAQPRVKARKVGKSISVYTPATAKEWKSEVKGKVSPYRGASVKGQALQLSLYFRILRPASHLKKDGCLRKGINENHVQKPDVDNLAKAVMDAMSDAGVWHDDDQVTVLRASKEWVDYGSDAGCWIRLEAV